MAEKDISEKVLMSYADVFADCENALAYGGELKLRAEHLQPAPTESFYIGGNKMHNQFCDESFYLVKNGTIKAQYIIENETQMKQRQILRKMSYHGGAYRLQFESKRPVYPVISFVIDWTRKSTRIPLSLHDLLAKNGMPQDEMHQIENVKLNVYHMRNLSKKVRNRFTSDMGFVVDYLNDGNFENRRNQKIIHAEALCQMMEALTKDARFTDLIGELIKRQEEKGGEIVMCEYIDMLEARGEARGIKKGEVIGEKRGLKTGEIIGEKRGFQKGETRLANLIQYLLKEKNYDAISLASSDSGKRQELYRIYGI